MDEQKEQTETSEQWELYRILPGETLQEIANRYNVSLDELFSYNQDRGLLQSPDVVQVGSFIYIKNA